MPSIRITTIARNPLDHQDWLDEQAELLARTAHLKATQRKAAVRASRDYWL